MLTLITTLLLLLGSVEEPNTKKENQEILEVLETKNSLFQSIEKIVESRVYVFDLEGNKLADFTLNEWVQNELGFEQLNQIENADFILETSGDLYYLASRG